MYMQSNNFNRIMKLRLLRKIQGCPICMKHRNLHGRYNHRNLKTFC